MDSPMPVQPIPFGVGFSPGIPAPRVIEAAQLAERLGYGTFWITDSHMAGREAIAMLGALAVSTQTITLGTGVSHLAGRHPSVLASAFSTLVELAPNRVRLGIGVGDSGPMNLGMARTSVQDLERAIVMVNDLSEGRTAAPFDEGGKPLKLSFGSPEHHVPIFVASSGERTQRMIGRVADGALISGMPAALPEGIAAVRAGEREAGRAPGSTRIVLWTTVSLDDDREAARNAVRGSVARRALNAYGRLARAGKLPADDAEAVVRLQTASAGAYRTEAEYHDLVPERWIDRFAIAGTPSEVTGRLQEAVNQGAQEIAMILMGAGSQRGGTDQLTRFATTVMRPMQLAGSSV